jgi:hypothetical protein
MSNTIYPKGLRVFSPNENAPDFVKGNVIITPRELTDWIKENANLLTDYKGQKQLKLQLLQGDKGLYFKVDDYKSKGNNSTSKDDDLPF